MTDNNYDVTYVYLDVPITYFHIDRLVQDRRNSSALVMELRLSSTKPSVCSLDFQPPSWILTHAWPKWAAIAVIT